MRRLFALLLLLACPIALAQAPQRTTEAAAIAALSQHAAELAAEDKFSGQLLVARRGKILLDQTLGMAYVVIGLANLDPDAATRAMIFFTRRMPLD